ncbi:MAG: polyisoprenoid-binding protein YceI [Maribacter sp.]|jgi:polyisoprenoid-binding protein YceI
MNKYLILLALPFTLWMCKPQSVAPNMNKIDSPDITFDKVSPGTLNWSANAGWEAKGTFNKWKIVSLDIPKKDFSQILVEIAVKISSVNHEDKGLENHLRKNDYLDAKKFPVAMISIKGATYNKEEENYTTSATLQLKGNTQMVPLTFSVEEGSPAKIKGSGTLMREDYKVGDDSGVRNDVGISFEFDLPE